MCRSAVVLDVSTTADRKQWAPWRAKWSQPRDQCRVVKVQEVQLHFVWHREHSFLWQIRCNWSSPRIGDVFSCVFPNNVTCAGGLAAIFWYECSGHCKRREPHLLEFFFHTFCSDRIFCKSVCECDRRSSFEIFSKEPKINAIGISSSA
jgi:hypothetical protein